MKALLGLLLAFAVIGGTMTAVMADTVDPTIVHGEQIQAP